MEKLEELFESERSWEAVSQERAELDIRTCIPFGPIIRLDEAQSPSLSPGNRRMSTCHSIHPAIPLRLRLLDNRLFLVPLFLPLPSVPLSSSCAFGLEFEDNNASV